MISIYIITWTICSIFVTIGLLFFNKKIFVKDIIYYICSPIVCLIAIPVFIIIVVGSFIEMIGDILGDRTIISIEKKE